MLEIFVDKTVLLRGPWPILDYTRLSIIIDILICRDVGKFDKFNRLICRDVGKFNKFKLE